MRKLHSSYFSLNVRALVETFFAQRTDTKFWYVGRGGTEGEIVSTWSNDNIKM